ncbi:MAG: hypothetical protein WC371_02560 [Parachlamydiales bacterium]|jgi:hypothetical protein
MTSFSPIAKGVRRSCSVPEGKAKAEMQAFFGGDAVFSAIGLPASLSTETLLYLDLEEPPSDLSKIEALLSNFSLRQFSQKQLERQKKILFSANPETLSPKLLKWRENLLFHELIHSVVKDFFGFEEKKEETASSNPTELPEEILF